MSRPAQGVGLANRPDPEPASADDGDAGRCAKASKPCSICYGQDVPGGFCPTVFRHVARYTSGSAPCATMGYSKVSIIISFGSMEYGQGENQHHPRQSCTARECTLPKQADPVGTKQARRKGDSNNLHCHRHQVTT